LGAIFLRVDYDELKRFTLWLPPLDRHQAYVLLLLTRTRDLRRKKKFKGSDAKLQSYAVHGALSGAIPAGADSPFDTSVEEWRLRYYSVVLRLEAMRRYAPFYYVRKRPDTKEPFDVARIPPETIMIYTTVSPSDVLDAAADVVAESARWAFASARGRADVFRRPDELYKSRLHAHVKARFHTIDVDDKALLDRLLTLLRETLGYRPAVIYTRRGGHILIDLRLLDELGATNRWVGPPAPELRRTVEAYMKEPAPALAKKIEEHVFSGASPLFHAIPALGVIYRDPETGGPLVEIKTKSIEPVPGTEHKGEIVRFEPEQL